MKFLKKDDVVFQDLGLGVSRKILVHNDELMMVEVHFEKGAVGSVHAHPHQQMSYILSGLFAFENDGETRTVGQGDSLLFSSGVKHGVVCLQEGTVLDIFTPTRKDFL